VELKDLKKVKILFFIIILFFNVILIGCVRKERDNTSPDARFTISPNDNIYVNHQVSFMDKSKDKDGEIVAWNWDFGDNTTSNLKNPIHIYIKPGTYTVSLQVIDDYETKSNISFQNITVSFTPPYAAFITDPIYLGNIEANSAIYFKDNSIPGDGNITEYLWDFGDGNTSNLTEFNHSYSKSGIYIVTLTIKDEYGEMDTTEKITIEVE
jgi:PKD repeat protein